MKKLLLPLVLVLIVIGLVWYGRRQMMTHNTTLTTIPAKATAVAQPVMRDDIIVVTPHSGAIATSPITISGEARGTWFSSGSFSVTVVDAKGKVIGSGTAQAKGDTTTGGFVPFSANVIYSGVSGAHATVILKGKAASVSVSVVLK